MWVTTGARLSECPREGKDVGELVGKNVSSVNCGTFSVCVHNLTHKGPKS